MTSVMPDADGTVTANQLVAYNLMRVRKALGLSQEEARERLRPFGLDLSKNSYSTAETSYRGKRIRQFTGDEIFIMSLAFGVPVAYFLLPPRPEDRPDGAVLVSGETEVSWHDLAATLGLGEVHPAIMMRLAELPATER